MIKQLFNLNYYFIFHIYYYLNNLFIDKTAAHKLVRLLILFIVLLIWAYYESRIFRGALNYYPKEHRFRNDSFAFFNVVERKYFTRSKYLCKTIVY